VQISAYAPGDEQEICQHAPLVGRELGADDDVWEVHPDARMTPERWAWRFAKNPLGKGPCVFVARAQGAIVGYASAVESSIALGERSYRAAQLFFDRTMDETALAQLSVALFERLRGQGVDLVYMTAPLGELAVARRLEMVPLFEVYARNLYLGLNKVSHTLDQQALRVVRRIAKEARRVRTKLYEVPVDDSQLEQAVRLFSANREEEQPDLALDKSIEWLRWRYADAMQDARMVVLRRRAGAGIDAFALLRVFEVEEGRWVIQVLDHATRHNGRRELAWLIGELALWGLAEKADVLQAFAAAGSELDQALVGSGCIRKKRERIFAARWLGAPLRVLDEAFPRKHIELRSGDIEP
jgi:hypothetical protein